MAIYYPPETIDEILEMDKLEYVEMQNPIREDELKDPHRRIKIELLGIIAAYQDPVCCNRIFRDYEEMNGCVLDPNEFGFKSFTSMMRTFSDKFNYHLDGVRTTYTAKTTERSAHLQDLIKNQVTIEEKRRRDMKRSRSYSRRRNSTYGAAFYYSQKFVPLLTDDRSAEERLADSLASFGRSWAAADERRGGGGEGGGGGLDWGGRKSRLEASSSSEDDETEGGLIVRSRSVPSRRSPMATRPPRVLDVRDDSDVDECINPFRAENNVRVRDVVIKYGEVDDTGRKGLGLLDVAQRFKTEYRQPLGGIPNLSEGKLMEKMSTVETMEWKVEKMGDNQAYVIVPVETIKRAHEVGPGTSCESRPVVEKPKINGISPAAKRMFGFAIKEAHSVNNRLTGTREKNVQERQTTYETIMAGSDGDPVMVEMEMPPSPSPPPRHRRPKVPEVPSSFDRSAMMSLSDHELSDSLDRKVESLVGSMRILRTQTSSSPNSAHSNLSSRSGTTTRGPLPRTTPPMSFGANSSGFGANSSGFGAIPTFGTFKSAPPPASVAAADSDDDPSDIIQPSQSNLASKLPQMSFGKQSTVPSFGTKMASAPAAPSGISFGTSSQSVPSPPPRSTVPTFGTTASSSSTPATSFPSAFGAPKPPAPKKMVEVVESEKKEEHNGAEVLGATIQLIGRLLGGDIVYMKEIERTPVEEVVANNLDFFDVDEKDDRIHLLHKDVDPKLLMFEGRQLGELAGEKKKEETPVAEPAKEERVGAFSRPTPSFGRSEGKPIPTFGTFTTPSIKGRELPTFGRPMKVVDEEKSERPTETIEPPKPQTAFPSFGNTVPSFGTMSGTKKVDEVEEKKTTEPVKPEPRREVPTFAPTRVAEPVRAVASTSIYQSPKPVNGMPSFGTKSLELQRPDSALSNRSEEPKKQSKYSSDSSTISSSSEDEEPEREIRPKVPSAIGRSSIHSVETSEDEEKDELIMEEEVVDTNHPYAFPSHKDIRSLCKKSSIDLDFVRVGSIYQGSILSSYHPNRIVFAMAEDNAVDNLHSIMHELSSAYDGVSPLGDAVRVGQFAVAINGECVVRVVVLKKTVEDGETIYECACLDINALIEVGGEHLYELFEKFNVSAIRATTFVARINGIADLTEKGHKAVKLTVKSQESDDNMKKLQPFVFHGKNGATSDMFVDVAVMIGDDCVWLGEMLPVMLLDPRMPGCKDIMNPDIKHAVEFALKHNIDGYKMKKEKEKEVKVEKKSEVETFHRAVTPNESDLVTLRSDSLEKLQDHKVYNTHLSASERETIVFTDGKEEGELDTSIDSLASEKTTVDRHSAGDFARDVKNEMPDEFVFVAPVASKAIIDVESMTSLIRLFNAKGENVEVDVIKSLCRALILSTNKTLSSLGERGALIANAEALDAIEMA